MNIQWFWRAWSQKVMNIQWFWRAWSQKVMNIKWFWRAWSQKVMNIQWFCDGFALLPFGVLFLKTPRREENTKTSIFLQFWTPGGAKMFPNHVFCYGFEHTPVATNAFHT